MSGAGNTFLVTYLPHLDSSLQKKLPAVSRQLCRKHDTDGLVVLQSSKEVDWEWLFYQKDGSTAEMCGNAACCVLEYLFKKELIQQGDITLKTKAGIIQGEWIKNSGKIFAKLSSNILGPFDFKFKESIYFYLFIQALVPHAVIELQNVSSILDKNSLEYQLGSQLRYCQAQYKDGMNVSFFTVLTQKPVPILQACTFERGVEGITLACGTGALAVATSYRYCYKDLVKKVYVQMQGGQLTVEFYNDGKVSLLSPVKWLDL